MRTIRPKLRTIKKKCAFCHFAMTVFQISTSLQKLFIKTALQGAKLNIFSFFLQLKKNLVHTKQKPNIENLFKNQVLETIFELLAAYQRVNVV